MMIFSKWGGRSKQQGSLAYPEHTFRARAELAEVLWWVRRRGAEPGSSKGGSGQRSTRVDMSNGSNEGSGNG